MSTSLPLSTFTCSYKQYILICILSVLLFFMLSLSFMILYVRCVFNYVLIPMFNGCLFISFQFEMCHTPIDNLYLKFTHIYSHHKQGVYDEIFIVVFNLQNNVNLIIYLYPYLYLIWNFFEVHLSLSNWYCFEILYLPLFSSYIKMDIIAKH